MILTKENISTSYFSLFDGHTTYSGDGVIAVKEGNKFIVHSVERQIPFENKTFTSEHDACVEFLKQCDICFLKKYKLSRYVN